jgi:hypothetical protein
MQQVHKLVLFLRKENLTAQAVGMSGNPTREFIHDFYIIFLQLSTIRKYLNILAHYKLYTFLTFVVKRCLFHNVR